MSGICGLLRLNTEPVSADDLACMTDVMQNRGPDGTKVWCQESIGLGHCALITTPEAVTEVQPLLDPGSGCVITADVRLDNRDAMLSALGGLSSGQTVGDAEIILQAYLRWGDDCVDHLLGDFAFAIWDPRTNRLFAARDHFGVRPLAYTVVPGQMFAFASDPEAVVRVKGVPKTLNEARVADFLEGTLEGVDYVSTFYEGVSRLPPAHTFTMVDGALHIRRYWRLTPGSPLTLPDDQAYARAFLKVFTEAVRCRLRSAGPVGAMLSGGMDSGSVVAVATRLLAEHGKGPLATFSATAADPTACVETAAIEVALAMPGLEPRRVNEAQLAQLAPELTPILESVSEPFDAHMTLPAAVYLAAHRAGVKVMLDGVSGDVVLSAGTFLERLIRRGRWRTAWRECHAEAAFYGLPLLGRRQFLRAVWRAAVPRPWRQRRIRLMLRRNARRGWPESLVDASFARKINLLGRWDMYNNHDFGGGLTAAEERAHTLCQPFLVAGRERYGRVAAQLGIEPRDPFLDRRVVEFCMSLPPDQLQAGGWPKMILRRALANLLPEAIRWRRGKEHLGWAFTLALLPSWPRWRIWREQGGETCAKYARRDLTSDDSGRVAESLRLFYLETWLEDFLGDDL